MTIHQAYQQLLFRLYELYDNHEAANIADMVLEHVTGQRKIDRIMYRDLPVDHAQQDALNNIADDLLTGKPVQYVLHEAWFANMCLYVDEHVLIPRPETEELVDWIIKDHRSTEKPLQLLDIGTGSGCIPIAIKKYFPEWLVSAIDISEGALSVAQKNATAQATEITFIPMDFLLTEQWSALGEFDIIVSNPPYIRQQESADMHRNVLDHEPSIALFVADDDALVFYRHIVSFAQQHLRTGGSVYAEINEALGDATVELFKKAGFATALRKDMQGKDRMVKSVNANKLIGLLVD